MEDDLEKEIDRGVITDEILLEIIPVSDEKFGGSKEIALENAKKAYINFKTGFKKCKKEPFDETGFAKMFNNPISTKASASLIRLGYYLSNIDYPSKGDLEHLENETKVFQETSEMMHLYHEYLADRE